MEDEAFEEEVGWHAFLKDEGCYLWDSCLNCALPACKDDVGEARARAAAKAAGITPMTLPSQRRPLRNGTYHTVADRVLPHLRNGWSITKTATATGIKWEHVARVFYKNGYERRPATAKKDTQLAAAI